MPRYYFISSFASPGSWSYGRRHRRDDWLSLIICKIRLDRYWIFGKCFLLFCQIISCYMDVCLRVCGASLSASAPWISTARMRLISHLFSHRVLHPIPGPANIFLVLCNFGLTNRPWPPCSPLDFDLTCLAESFDNHSAFGSFPTLITVFLLVFQMVWSGFSFCRLPSFYWLSKQIQCSLASISYFSANLEDSQHLFSQILLVLSLPAMQIKALFSLPGRAIDTAATKSQ